MNNHCSETINRIETLASPPSAHQAISDRVGAWVVLGGEGTLASPPCRVHESDMIYTPAMGGPRAPAPHPHNPRPYANLGHYGVPALTLLILFILVLFLFPLS